MKLLSLECSAAAASAAVFSDGALTGEYFVNIKQTHSQTLLPMTERLLSSVSAEMGDIDYFAVAHGPGSFTGLRIGIAAVKGMAFGRDACCIGLSTLEAMAYNLRCHSGIVCGVMDARCKQVYTALFSAEDGTVARLTEDMAIPLAELEKLISGQKKPVYLVGDGALLCYNYLSERQPLVKLAPAELRLQRAASVGALALERLDTAVAPRDLAPVYLRLPQAERERLAREPGGTKD